MKKAITQLILMTFGLFMLSTGVMAQQYDVPSVYPSIEAAVDAINLALTEDATITEVTIMIEEGILVERNSNHGFNRAVTAIFQGAGVDKTFVDSRRGGRAIPGEPDSLSNRFMEITNEVDGMDLIFQDITFRYFGRGDNDNGGMFSTSTTKGFNTKYTFENCVFDSLCAKQGAIGIFANALTELLMDNCLVQNCLSYGGSAFAGLIAVDNGGTYEITNTTFIGNERHPWDHRANPENPIDKGAGRGGLLKFQSGTLRNVPEPYPFGPVSLLMENCSFVNNMPLAVASDSIHPAVQLDGVKDTTANDITLIDNIFVGNKRDGFDTTDVDIRLPETMENAKWDLSGNIANTIVTKDSLYRYVTDLEGFKIDQNYTYTHPCIDFTMDGDLPELILDGDGIAYVEFSGDGGTPGTIIISGITVTPDAATVDPGATLQLGVTLDPADASAAGLVWSVEDGTGTATIDASGVLTPGNSGTVTVTATSEYCGAVVTGNMEVTVTGTVGINRNLETSINVYPNPSNGLFDVILSDQMQNATYEVFSITGNIVKSGVLNKNHSSLDLTDAGTGMYILKVKDEIKSSMTRLIVE